MAQGGSTEGRFPPEIVASDDDPSNGYYSIMLTIPGMKTTKKFYEKVPTVTNGDCEVHLKNDDVSVTAKVEDSGKTTEYTYYKKLPEDIVLLKSKHKIKDGRVILILCKKEKLSWGQHTSHFMKRS